MFPVGLVSGSPVSTPIVENDAYAGFYIGWDGNRKFPLDMAGFAFSVEHYRKVLKILSYIITETNYHTKNNNLGQFIQTFVNAICERI